MTIQDPENIPNLDEFDSEEEEKKEKKKRSVLLFLLMALLVMLCCSGGLFGRYLWKPEPLPDLLPLPLEVNYSPHYLFSMYGVDKPIGVSISPQGDRIYVSETGSERLVKIFDREGNLLGSFAPPRTGPGQRAPVYLATDSTGRVFVTDRLQHAVFVYDSQGTYLDTILAPDMTLSEYMAKHVSDLHLSATFAYNVFEAEAYYWQQEGDDSLTFPAPDREGWSPLGVRFDDTDRMLLTDVSTQDFSAVREFPANVIQTNSWQEFNPPNSMFGAYGQEYGQFIFPNVAVTDSQGRIYVTDGNNSRISVWDRQSNFLYNFGQGTGDGSLSLPRGATVDAQDRLYVVDAVGQNVNVYDVSSEEPNFLFAFGDWGKGDGQFDYPNDIVLDDTGRMYVADRENNRIQVWSY